MTDLHLDATSRTPAIALEQTARRLVIAGESYPEDVSGFYAALTTALEGYFAGGAGDAMPRTVEKHQIVEIADPPDPIEITADKVLWLPNGAGLAKMATKRLW